MTCACCSEPFTHRLPGPLCDYHYSVHKDLTTDPAFWLRTRLDTNYPSHEGETYIFWKDMERNPRWDEYVDAKSEKGLYVHCATGYLEPREFCKRLQSLIDGGMTGFDAEVHFELPPSERIRGRRIWGRYRKQHPMAEVVRHRIERKLARIANRSTALKHA